MGSILSKYIEVIGDVLIFSLVFLIVALFAGVSSKAHNLKVETNATMVEMRHYREMYEYINTEVVTGDDIVRFIGKFRRELDVDIINKGKTYSLKMGDTSSSKWDIEEVIKFIGMTAIDTYRVTPVQDKYSGRIEKITFKLE